MGNENAALAAALANLHRVVEKVQRETAPSDALLSQQNKNWPTGYSRLLTLAF
jgi:hypothetical protein